MAAQLRALIPRSQLGDLRDRGAELPRARRLAALPQPNHRLFRRHARRNHRALRHQADGHHALPRAPRHRPQPPGPHPGPRRAAARLRARLVPAAAHPPLQTDKPKRKTPASASWLQIFVRQCDRDCLPHLAALVLFMATTGARISEAVRLQLARGRSRSAPLPAAAHQDRHQLTARPLRRRGGPAASPARCAGTARLHLHVALLGQRTHPRRLHRAGISYKSPHLCGRHSFATNALANGIDIKTAMEAGDWKSSESSSKPTCTSATPAAASPTASTQSSSQRFIASTFSGTRGLGCLSVRFYRSSIGVKIAMSFPRPAKLAIGRRARPNLALPRSSFRHRTPG
jgi:integrase